MSTIPSLSPSTDAERAVQRCTIATRAGAFLSDGRAVLIARAGGSEVRVTEFSHPGALLNAYINRGMRYYTLTFEDGRGVAAELVDTTWERGGRRLCRFLLQSGDSVSA